MSSRTRHAWQFALMRHGWVKLLLIAAVLQLARLSLQQQLDAASHALSSAPAAAPFTPSDHHNHAALPFCEHHVGKLPAGPQGRDAVRDILQAMQLQHKIIKDTKSLIERKQKQYDSTTPAEVEAERRAYDTPLTEEELRQRLEAAENLARQLEGRVKESMRSLKQQGLIQEATTETILSSCLMGRLNPRLYPGRPQISFMLQYFKRPWMIQPILDALRTCTDVASELLVNVDSPDEHKIWAELAHNTSGYVVPVFSANVHEIRAYNRLAGLARGRVVIVLQDDLKPPTGCHWQTDILSLFDTLPRLAALGLKSFRFNTRRDNVNVTGRDAFFTEPITGLPMNYAQLVDFAPMAMLRAAFKHVGGLDEGISEPGMCGIYSDFEVSVRFWAAGWHVGFHPLRGHEPDRSGVPSGTHKPETEWRCWRRQMGLSGGVYEERWIGPVRPAPLQEALARTVRSLNLRQLRRIPGMHCPFSNALGGCDPDSGSVHPNGTTL